MQGLDASNLLTIIPVIFVSMAIHEAMHAFTSHWLGDTTARDMGRLTLNPLKHIDLVTTVLLPAVLILAGLPPIFVAKPVPFNPDRVKFDEFGAALIGLAGPFTNLLLAILGSIVLRKVNMPTSIFNVLATSVVVNVAMFVFNMIPFPPLDGSRLLYALAPEPLQRLMYRIESMGFMVLLLFFVIFGSVFGPVLVYANNHILHLLVGVAYPV